MNAITITAMDQARMRSDYIRRSWPVFAITGLVFALGLLGAAVNLPSDPSAAWLAMLLPMVAVTFAGWILRLVRRSFALNYPVGSEHHLRLSEETLDLVGVAGASQIRWKNLARVKHSSGAIYLTILPGPRQLVLPVRLVTDEARAVIEERIGVQGVASLRHGRHH